MRISLRLTIGTFISLLIAVTGGVILAISYLDSRETILESSHQLIEQIGSATEERIAAHLLATRRAVILTGDLVHSGTILPAVERSLEAYFFDFLDTHQAVTMMSYADAAGRGLSLEREPDGSYKTVIVRPSATGREGKRFHAVEHTRSPGDPFERFTASPSSRDISDPRKEPWYAAWGGEKERPSHEAHWTEIFILDEEGRPGIGVSVAHRDSRGAVRGVFGVEVSLAELSHFLSEQRIGKNGKAFITDKRERIFAISKGDLVSAAKSESVREGEFRSLKSGLHPELQAFGAHALVRRTFRTGEKARFRYMSDGVGFLASLAPVKNEGVPGWYVGVVVPEDDFLGGLKRTLSLSLAATALMLGAAFLIGLWFSGYLARSLKKLVVAARRIRGLDFSPSESSDFIFEEIHDVMAAFEKMKTGLRSFARYVPVEVVRRLVKEKVEPELGGESRELTVLFSDIEDFTSISESMDGPQLAADLGRYFTIFTETIQSPQSEGIVDKFIGDAVMAFWGAPNEVRDHPLKACRSALECQRRIAGLREKDPSFPNFSTRIGIHTEEVLVGNFGSSERLNYTCLGDGVNLASRLEALNKYYGTRILISESVFERIGSDFETRMLDRVAVKGSSRGVAVYELLGERGEVPPEQVERCRVYEQALSAYFGRRWSDAKDCLSRFLESSPRDVSGKRLLDRVVHFEHHSPPDDWEGVWFMDTK